MNGQLFALSAAGAVMLALLGWSVWRVFRPADSGLAQPVLFFLLVGLCLLVLRRPSITWFEEFNPDESQMIAQGMRFLAHPIPWRDVDTTTSGPLNSMALSIPMFFGAPATWQTARIVLVALIWLTLLFLYLAFRNFGTHFEAQFALMPTVFFYAFATDRSYTHYSSEALPVLLLSVDVFLLARAWCAEPSSRILWFMLGLVSGSIPFTKLQAAPLALLLAMAGFAMILLQRRRGPNFIGWQVAAWCLGGLTMPGIILGVVLAAGAFRDFWTSYILATGIYASGESLLKRISILAALLTSGSRFRLSSFSAVMALLLLAAAWLNRSSRLTTRLFWPLMVNLAALSLTLLCLLTAGKMFHHYTLLLIPALGALYGLVYFAGRAMLQGDSATAQNPAGRFTVWLAAFSLLVVASEAYKAPQFVFRMREYVLPPQRPVLSAVGRSARAASRPGDTLSVWGWTPSYYIESGLMPATRDSVSAYLIFDSPYRNFFRQRYLNDLRQARPAFFIDAISEDNFHWNWPLDQTHESFPELANFIAQNYSLWRSVPNEDEVDEGDPVRIYVLKERLAGLEHVPVYEDTANPLFKAP